MSPGAVIPVATVPVAPVPVVIVLLAATALLAAACSSNADDDGAGPDAASDQAGAESDQTGAGDDPGGDDPAGDGGSAESEGDDGGTNPIRDPASIGILPRVRLPVVPPIALPDLSELGRRGDELNEQLASLAGAGVDVIGASCAAIGGELVYQGGSGDSFFDLADDGSGVYRDLDGGNDVEVRIEADGSGVYRDRSGGNDIEILVEADGSGTYREELGTSTLTIDVEVDGSGTYRNLGNNIDEEVVIVGDGSGSLTNGTFSRDLEVRVEADGSGSYRNFGANKEITLEVAADGSMTFRDQSNNADVELVVEADGSGSLTNRSGGKDRRIVVDADGTGTFVDAGTGLDVAFRTEIGILDPDLLVAGPMPVFAVADRFPPLDSLGRLEPPCVTVVRLGADVLFDFNSADLRPEVESVVDQLAEALLVTDQTIEIHGHTDSVGDEAYNQDLAAQRAATFAEALVSRGVTTELRIVSFGETRPAAPNERPDGSDDPAGRQLNRRIEIVVPES